VACGGRFSVVKGEPSAKGAGSLNN
jgi:hypothetical protein